MGIPSSDRVQPIKWESTSEGGSTNETFPAGVDPQQDALEVRGLYLEPILPDPRDETTYVYRDGDDLKFRDVTVGNEVTLTQLLNSGAITDGAHKVLRHLIHFVSEGPGDGFASGAYKEVTGSVFPTAIVWWESSAKLKKIVERLVTWTGAKVTQDQWKIYDASGSLLATVTDTLSYSGVFETNRTRAIS
jgi:hypothetical protein